MYGCHCHSTSPLSSVLRRGVKSQCKCDLMFKVYPVIFCLQYVIAPVLLLAHFQSPWQLQKYNESSLSLSLFFSVSLCRMYILIRNKVLQLSLHFLLCYFNKLERQKIGKIGVLHYGPPPVCEPSLKHNLNNSISPR